MLISAKTPKKGRTRSYVILTSMASRETSRSAAVQLPAQGVNTSTVVDTLQMHGVNTPTEGALLASLRGSTVVNPPAVCTGGSNKRSFRDLEGCAVVAASGRPAHLLKYVTEGAKPPLTHSPRPALAHRCHP